MFFRYLLTVDMTFIIVVTSMRERSNALIFAVTFYVFRYLPTVDMTFIIVVTSTIGEVYCFNICCYYLCFLDISLRSLWRFLLSSPRQQERS